MFHIAGDKFQHISDVEPLVTADRKSRPSQSDAGLESADRQKAANKQALLRVSALVVTVSDRYGFKSQHQSLSYYFLTKIPSF